MHWLDFDPNPQESHKWAAIWAKGAAHFTHCVDLEPNPHELQR